jgi:hypothetical protein
LLADKDEVLQDLEMVVEENPLRTVNLYLPEMDAPQPACKERVVSDPVRRYAELVVISVRHPVDNTGSQTLKLVPELRCT